MNFHELYEEYYRAQVLGGIPPNSTAKDRSIIDTLEKYSTPNKPDSKIRECDNGFQEGQDTRNSRPRRRTKRKRSGEAAHSTASSRGVKTDTKNIWKLIKTR